MKCALCQSSGPLQNSHIIPEFFYKGLYDKIHRFHTIPFDTFKLEDFEQKGLREKLLCKVCEQKFSVWEKYVKEAFGDGVGIKVESSKAFVKLSNLDYRKFRCFLLSLLWRMGVSSLDFFTLVKLGDKHEEILRLALLNEDPLDPLQYPCVLFIVQDDRFPTSWISQPIHSKSDSRHYYCIFIGGILFYFYVTSHSLPTVLAEACISQEDEMRMLFKKIQEIPFLADSFSKLGRSVLSRRQVSRRQGE